MKKSTVNKLIKITSTLMMVMICLTICTAVFADGFIIQPGDIEATDAGGTATKIQTIAGGILGIVQVIGIAVAVIMLIVLAIKYISAAPNDKAEIKKHAVVYIVGAIVLFASVGILQIIKQFSDIINK